MKYFNSENSSRAVAVVPVDGDTVTLTGSSGTCNIVVNGVNYLATFDTDLDETSEDFKATHKAALGLRGVNIAVVGSVKQVDTITVTGDSGTATIAAAGGLSLVATFDTNLTTTNENFVTANAAAYLAVGIVLTSSVADLIFTSVSAGGEFAHPTITNLVSNLAGSVANTTPPASLLVFSKKRSHIVTERVIVTVSAAVTGDLTGTIAGTIVPDFNVGRVYQIAASCPITIGKALNPRDGQAIRFEITAAGAFGVTWNAAYQFPGGTEHTQTSTALDILEGFYNAAADKVYLTVEGADVKA